jgi:hypothetical protein
MLLHASISSLLLLAPKQNIDGPDHKHVHGKCCPLLAGAGHRGAGHHFGQHRPAAAGHGVAAAADSQGASHQGTDQGTSQGCTQHDQAGEERYHKAQEAHGWA